MSEKNEIIKKYKLKIIKLKQHNDLYYNKDNPKISDATYDDLKNEIYEFEKKFLYLKKLDLTKNIVGSPLTNRFKKIKHLRPMLSLSNSFNKSDMMDFLKKINNFLNLDNTEVELFA